jgi:hypothetical protein
MKSVSFVGAYAEAWFAKNVDCLDCKDPIQMYRNAFHLMAGLSEPDPERCEPPVELEMKYRDDYNFTIKGKSFWLFQKLMDNLCDWTFKKTAADLPTACLQIDRLIDWVVDMIEYEDVEFDSEIFFKLKTINSFAFEITVGGEVLDSKSWWQTITVVHGH